MNKWIKKGDKILVIAGNDKGKTGDVIARSGDRIRIQGINIRKKHVKREGKAPGAGIIEMECPIHISNVSLCNSAGDAIKLKVKENKSGNKELYYLDGGKEVNFRELKKKS